MTSALLASALLAAGAHGLETLRVKRGELTQRVLVSGTVAAEGVFLVRAPVAGRVEEVSASTGNWSAAGRPLALLADKQLAALRDAGGDPGRESQAKWREMFKPAPAACPADCYVLGVRVSRGAWVEAGQPMFEAARGLTLRGRARWQDEQLVKDGQELAFWPADRPTRRHTAKVARYERGENGGTFVLELEPGTELRHGDEWDGEVVVKRLTDALLVPSAALIRRGGDVYLPVRVTPAETVGTTTRLASGVSEGQAYLSLDEERRRELEEEPDDRRP